MFKALQMRLRRLETAALDDCGGVCPSCRGPKPGMNMLVFLLPDGAPLHGRCAACGLALDSDGKALCAMASTSAPRPASKRYHADVHELYQRI